MELNSLKLNDFNLICAEYSLGTRLSMQRKRNIIRFHIAGIEIEIANLELDANSHGRTDRQLDRRKTNEQTNRTNSQTFVTVGAFYEN